MKFNLKMPVDLKPYYEKEVMDYRKALTRDHQDQVWYHLERAHIIAQAYPWPHTKVHWKMLCQGVREKSFREIFGQVIRLSLGGPFSFINQIPKGNIGSTKVSMTKPQQIPVDIMKMFSELENN
ncbi:MAG: DUF3703 domain-containing protein [Reichenbachiella sp.]|uniref:DUF3703 domain-containing protein n=2 Tax=Reichenbachiella sp. TaxID=2184521 RepID=UPI0032658646